MNTQPILVAIDLEILNQQLIEQAWSMAESQDRCVYFLHIVHKANRQAWLSQADEQELLHRLQVLTGLPRGTSNSPVGFQHAVRVGNPAKELIAFAKEIHANTIIMGSRNRGRLSHLVLGSVTEDVLRNAPCPVLVISDKQPETWDNPGHDAAAAETELIERRALATSAPFRDHETNRLVDLLQRAVQYRATDVHLDPVESDRVKIRFRIDGKLRTFCHLDSSIASPLLMQLKLMADLDTTQSFIPQEGRLTLPDALDALDVRVTIVPACGGDAVALRILRNQADPRPLSSLGMSQGTLESVQEMLHHREGLVLVTGPTGSGKTTTVYSMLQTLGYAERIVVSIEDPVEYRVPGIRQMSVNTRHDLSLARGLKTMLRMDPDVVFIGEIRDPEALDIAMRAGSSGRYVFTTLHTRDVASTVTALRDLRADNYSLAANLTGIVSQRLIRRLCQHCRQQVPTTAEEKQIFLAEGIAPPDEIYRSVGCEMCLASGYRDRFGIFEAVVSNEEIVKALQTGAPEDDLRKIIRSCRSKGLLHDALQKAKEGETSIAEACSLGRN